MPDKLESGLIERILPIRIVIFDVDGVLTDGGIIYTDTGAEVKEFNVQDGHGMKLLQRAGIQAALITGRESRVVSLRAADLGITHVYQGSKVKIEAFEKLLADTGLEDHQAAYMGDDLIDIPVMRRAGLSVAVPNATRHVLPYAHYVTKAPGGRGAAREVCEMILQAQGLWETVTERYFK